ncbi:MAG: nitroreductase family protein [Peptococcaceae bacterium]|nr:nitroreductase family protein [Peptococcaceae bacterium]
MDLDTLTSAIRSRKSVRSYAPEPLSAHDDAILDVALHTASNPFGETVHLYKLAQDTAARGERLGTYGIIRGAQTFIGASAQPTPLAPLALGYEVEQVILRLTAAGLGTVWLGGTFKRSAFARAMGVPASEWFPAIVPVGVAAAKRGSAERLMRVVAKSDQREAWRDLFTEDGFQIQLSEEAAGRYALPLEMLRLAPSALNAQPWRVVKAGRAFHFFETHKTGSSVNEARLKGVDLGIAIAHFHLTAQALDLAGHFAVQPLAGVHIPENTIYHISWICDD